MSFQKERPVAFQEKVLDETSARIERHLSSLWEAQQEMEAVAFGKTLLLIDTTMGNPSVLMEKGIGQLRERGWSQLAELYLQKLFGGRVPENSLEIFQQFLGPTVSLQHADIRKRPTKVGKEEIDAVLFSGSPADVSKAVGSPDEKITIGGKEVEFTHRFVLQTAGRLYEQAAEQDIPVLGICYGHQLVSHLKGGNVRPMTRYVKGKTHVQPTEYGAKFLAGVFGQSPALKGNIATFQGESVFAPGERSTLLLQADSEAPNMIQGLMHVSEKLSGDTISDAERVKQLLADSRHAALTVQGHPEYTGALPLIQFGIEGDLSAFAGGSEDAWIADQMLQLFSRFLAQYGN